MQPVVRDARVDDAAVLAGLLHAFNEEFGHPSPGREVLAERLTRFLERGEVVALLVGDPPTGEPPAGFALLSFRPVVWDAAPSAMLDELYVLPDRRGEGLGRALLRRAFAVAQSRHAERFEVLTGEGDTAARRLYEAHGLSNADPGETDRLLYYYRRL